MDKTLHYLDIIEQHRDNYDEKMGDILSDYDFVLENDSEYEFPENARERYQLLKDSTCRFHLTQYEFDFLQYAFQNEDIDFIKGEIADLEKYVNHERLTDEAKQSILYWQAVKFFVSCCNKLYGIGVEPPASEEDIILYFIVLHKKNYFDTFLLPDESLMVDFPNNTKNIERISKVYSRYVLFYKLLQDRKTELENRGSTNVLAPAVEPKKEIVVSTLYDLFLPEHRDKYEKLVSILTADIAKKELKDYVRIKKPLFTVIDNDTHKLRLNSFTGSLSYLAGVLIYLNDKKWIENKRISELHKVSNKVFSTKVKDHSIFSKVNSYNSSSNYFLTDVTKLLDSKMLS